MTTGGQVDDYVDDTSIYDFETKQWTEGPKMKTARRQHGCAKFYVQENPILIVAGGKDQDREDLKSVEFLDLENNGPEWIEGMLWFFRYRIF